MSDDEDMWEKFLSSTDSLVPPGATSQNPSIFEMDYDRYERGNSSVQDSIMEQVRQEENKQVQISSKRSRESSQKTSEGGLESLHEGIRIMDSGNQRKETLGNILSSSPMVPSGLETKDLSSFHAFNQNYGEAPTFADLIKQQQVAHRELEQRNNPFHISNARESSQKTSEGGLKSLHEGRRIMDSGKQQKETWENILSSSPTVPSALETNDLSSFHAFNQNYGEAPTFADLIKQQQVAHRELELRNNPFHISNASELTQKTSEGRRERLHIGGSNLDAKKDKRQRLIKLGGPSSSPLVHSGLKPKDHSSFNAYNQNYGKISFDQLIAEQEQEQRRNLIQISDASGSSSKALDISQTLFEVEITSSNGLRILYDLARDYFIPSKPEPEPHHLRDYPLHLTTRVANQKWVMRYECFQEEGSYIIVRGWEDYVAWYGLKPGDRVRFCRNDEKTREGVNENNFIIDPVYKRPSGDSDSSLVEAFHPPLFMTENRLCDLRLSKMGTLTMPGVDIPSLSREKERVKLTDDSGKNWYVIIERCEDGYMISDSWVGIVREHRPRIGDIVRLYYMPGSADHKKHFFITFGKPRD